MIGLSSIIFDNSNVSSSEAQSEMKMHADRYAKKVEEVKAMARARFLTLLPIGEGGGDWQVANDKNEKVFPQYKNASCLQDARSFLIGLS